jgi:ABC-2 type transport system ATP-binding protein
MTDPSLIKNKQIIAKNDVMIDVNDITKSFGEVKGITFTVRRGEFFGFLGPNGAGKTTTINMLTGLARTDSGTVSIAGLDCTANPRAAQHLIGVVADESNLYPELTGFDNLCFCGALYGMGRAARKKRARELLDTFGLSEASDRLFKGYSRGMKRKLAIAAGIIHDPEILFLDEPTTGIDVAGARQIRRLLEELSASGTTIFLTTHYIEEAERLCERIAFIVEGRIVKTDSVKSLLEPVADKHIMTLSLSGEITAELPRLTGAFPDCTFEIIHQQNLRVDSSSPVRLAPLVRFLEERNIEVLQAGRMTPSLEDVFVEVTGIEAEVLKKDNNRKGKQGNS